MKSAASSSKRSNTRFAAISRLNSRLPLAACAAATLGVVAMSRKPLRMVAPSAPRGASYRRHADEAGQRLEALGPANPVRPIADRRVALVSEREIRETRDVRDRRTVE